jgi:hypothetical protein
MQSSVEAHVTPVRNADRFTPAAASGTVLLAVDEASPHAETRKTVAPIAALHALRFIPAIHC